MAHSCARTCLLAWVQPVVAQTKQVRHYQRCNMFSCPAVKHCAHLTSIIYYLFPSPPVPACLASRLTSRLASRLALTAADHAGPAPCQLVDDWCAGEGDRRSQADCDGDGGLDWVCINPGSGARAASTTSRNCNTDWDMTGWPSADATFCPRVFTSA